MHTWIKICGTTSREDALKAMDAGADALGFVFCPSKRRITAEEAQQIIAALPSSIERIGVFMDTPVAEIAAIVGAVDLTGIQMQGQESPVEVYGCLPHPRRDLMRKIKTIMFQEGFEKMLDQYSVPASRVDAWLFDSGAGSGKTFNWREAKTKLGDRQGTFVIAGGLTPENVGEAISTFAPWGVDVVTGVESTPRKKDAVKMRAFVEAVRKAEQR